MAKVKTLLKPDKAKVLLAVVLLGVIALGLGQGWVFADQSGPRPPWALPGLLGMLAWTAGVYLMVPVMMINLPLVLLFDFDLFQVPGLPLLLAMVMAYFWAVFFVTAWRILREKRHN